jgi:protein SCO1/2
MIRTLLIAGLVIIAMPWASVSAESELPAELQEIRIDQQLDAMLPLDLVFTDSQGREVKLGDYFGEKPVILSLVYYECPMLCTMVLNGLVSSVRLLDSSIGEDYDVISVSIDPDEGSELAAAKKAEYLNRYGREGAGDGWHFLTGEESSIRKLAATVGFKYRYLPDRDEYAHAAGIMVITPEGRVSRYFYGIDYSPRDLNLGLVESSEGRIGTLADQVLLFCYRYDPVTGKYGAATVALVRAGGVATIAVLCIFFLVMWRRERSAARAGGVQAS